MPGLNRLGCKDEYSPPSNAEVKNWWSYASIRNAPPSCAAQFEGRTALSFTDRRRRREKPSKSLKITAQSRRV
jgi:hypothetical protein